MRYFSAFIRVFGMIVGALALTQAPAFAQDPNGPTPQQQIISLAHLPSLERLKKDPRWSDEDSRLAVNLVREYLNKVGQEFPIDCRFDIQSVSYNSYQFSEDRNTVENRLRRMRIPMVMFEQQSVWPDYPGTEKFKPLHPDNPEWQRFLDTDLKQVDSFLRGQYREVPPYGPRALSELHLPGYESVCDDIQRYLAFTYKVYPASRVTCGAGAYYINAYKMSFPYAYGYQYKLISVRDCKFPVKVRDHERDLDEDPNQQAARDRAQQTLYGSVKSGNVDSKRVRNQAERDENRRIKEEERQERVDNKREEQANKDAEQRLAEYRKKTEPIWVPQDARNQTVNSQGELGQKLESSYKKINDHPFDIQKQFQKDEKTLTELQKRLLDDEKKAQDTLNSKVGIKDEVVSVELDPKEPFRIVEIPLDTPFNSQSMLSFIENYDGQKDNAWLFGCRGYSLVERDENGLQFPKQSYIRCLVPHFIVRTKSSTAEIRHVRLPYPAIINDMKALKNQCGVMTGTRNGHHFGFRWLNLLTTKKYPVNTYEAIGFNKGLKRPVELPIRGGIKGRILDLITKLPIEGARAKIYPNTGPMSMLTSAGGDFEFKDFPTRGLRLEIEGSHRKYQDGAGSITNVRMGEVAPQPDFYLDPIRIKLKGQVEETWHPKYGSGIKGIKVAFVGYDKQFYAYTNAKGEFEMEDVPVSLSKMFSTDPTRGHDDGTLTVNLEPNENYENAVLKMEPRVTQITGKVTIPNRRAIQGLTVRLDGHPEFSTVTDENGNYKFYDIPIEQTTLTVVGDQEKIYLSRTVDLTTLPPYEHTTKDIVVPYTRSDVSGRVRDILENVPLSNIPVWVEGAKERYHATTDGNGYYKIIEVPTTAKVLKLETPGNKYVDRPRPIDPKPQPGKDVTKQDFNLIPRGYSKDKIVFVITWNEKQYDLDSQLFLPDEQHLFFKTIGNNSIQSAGGAALDKDDTGTSGRETTTITLDHGKTRMPGSYAFLIYQYVDNHNSFAEADTIVEVYKDDTFDKEIVPGQYRGRLWYVADVNNGQVDEVNQFPVDVESQIRDVAESVKNKEQEIRNMKSALKDDARAIADMPNQNKRNIAELADLEKRLPTMKDGPPNSAEFLAKMDLKKQISELKNKIVNFPNDLQAAKDALAHKTQQASNADVDLDHFKQNAATQTGQLQKNLAASIRNLRNYR